ncbi:fumarate reductase/succinate dehydrogenase flavoprotein, partial [Aureobasidium melanogenum]
MALQDSNKRLLESLEVNNEVLDNIHEELKTIVFERTMKIHSFQESRGITGMKGSTEKVVDDFSSKLDLPRTLETVESIDANHMQMARYSSRNDQDYRAIAGVLKTFVRQELGNQQVTPSVVVDPADVALPFARDDLFVGREHILAQISERREVASSHPRVALVELGGAGKPQIATGNTNAATNVIGGHRGVIKVEPMGEEDALQLLHTRVPFSDATRADAKKLVHKLEYIPLAITHAGAYIESRASTTTIATYLDLFRESESNQHPACGNRNMANIVPADPGDRAAGRQSACAHESTYAKCIRDAIDASGEPPVDQLKEWYQQADPGSLPTEDFWKLCRELQEYKRSYMEYWSSMGAKTVSGRAIDGVILPVSPHAASQKGTDRYFGYTAVANALDLPSCTFPVTGRGSVFDIEPNALPADHSQGLRDPSTGQRFFMIVERALPQCIIIDSSGKRFMNEAQSYTDAGQAMYKRNREVSAIPAWIVLDTNHRRKYPLASMIPGYTPRSAIDSGFVFRGKTLNNLAKQIGIDADSLTKTVERFNTMARRGKDNDFGRGENKYDRFFADDGIEPNSDLTPIERAPFYAVKVWPGDLGTKGGLLTNENACVIDTNGKPIEELYAAGNTSA